MGYQLSWFGGRLTELTEAECWDLLSSRPVGRIAFDEGSAGLAVLPVNYVVGERTIRFRTAPQSTIGLHVRGRRVAFEVDEIDEYTRSGWSVLVRGRAEFVDQVGPPGRAGEAPSPWPSDYRPLLVEITPLLVTGRRLLAS
ncbi:MAG: pyridoxamine 5'-phosphate oxidase family protein [Nocardioides sp.]